MAGRLAPLALDQPVDRLLRHPPPGRQLAAGDRQHPRGGLVELRLARDVDRLLRVAGRDQRPHPGVGADQVAGAERDAEELVDRVEQVLDVVPRPGAGWSMSPSKSLSVVPTRVRPYQGRAKIARPSPAGTMQAASPVESIVAVDQHVGAAAGRDPRHVLLLDRLLGPDPVGEDAGRVDTLSASTSIRSPESASTKATPLARPSARADTSVTSAPFSIAAPKRSASPRIVRTRRTSSVWQS